MRWIKELKCHISLQIVAITFLRSYNIMKKFEFILLGCHDMISVSDLWHQIIFVSEHIPFPNVRHGELLDIANYNG